MCEICLALAPRTCVGPANRPPAPRPGPPDPPAPSARGLVCSCVGSLDLCLAFGTNFSLLGFLVGGNGIKLSLHAEKAPHRAISGEQGEFCTAHAARRGVPGEFCTGSGPARLVLGEFCLASGPGGLASGDLCPNLSPRVSPARSYASPNGAIHPNATCRSARGRGPGRSQQQISSDNYLNNFKAFGPIMNGAKIIDDPSPTPKPPITSVTQWTPRYRRVMQIKTMNTRAAAHSR